MKKAASADLFNQRTLLDLYAIMIQKDERKRKVTHIASLIPLQRRTSILCGRDRAIG